MWLHLKYHCTEDVVNDTNERIMVVFANIVFLALRMGHQRVRLSINANLNRHTTPTMGVGGSDFYGKV
jgi:hypothetical protein